MAITQFSRDGQRVYYQKNIPAKDSLLFFINVDSPDIEKQIRFDGRLVSWQSLPGGGIVGTLAKEAIPYLTVVQDSGIQHSFRPLPFRSVQIMAVEPKADGRIAVMMELDNRELSGLYLIDPLLKQMPEGPILPFQQFTKMGFDAQLNPVAAVSRNQIGGKTIFRRSDSKWVAVRDYPFDLSMFMGGFQNIISTSSDGSTIYATDNHEKDKTTLIAIDTKSGAVKELVADQKTDILPFAPMLDRYGKPQMVFGVFAKARRHFLDPVAEADFRFVDSLWQGNASYAANSSDDQYWLLRRMGVDPTTIITSTGTIESLLSFLAITPFCPNIHSPNAMLPV